MSDANILRAVQTYNDGGLAYLMNSTPFINKANSKFKDFENIEGQLGDTVTFSKFTRFRSTNSLVVSFQGVEQRVESLTTDKPVSIAYSFTNQQFVYNVKDFMEEIGKRAIGEIATEVESDIAEVCKTSPFRFFGDGVTPLTNYSQLAKSLAFFRNFGAAPHDTCGFLDDLTIPSIVNSGLNQFTPGRNDRESMSWEIGNFSKSSWYQSNLLPVHTAGTEGEAGSTLTVVSTVQDADGAVTSITFSGTNSPTDANSVKEFDSFQFQDGVSGQSNIRFLTFVGHKPSQSPVQFRATSDASSSAGSEVTVSIYPALQASKGRNQNIDRQIVAGMKCTVLPSHRCGLIMSGNPLFLAMPRLPDETPFPTSRSTDPTTGCSLRTYYGSRFGENERGMVHDAIWGKRLVPEYALKLVIPLL